ncbi:MAG: sulfotransferase family protein [Phycisphaerales bacterium]
MPFDPNPRSSVGAISGPQKFLRDAVDAHLAGKTDIAVDLARQARAGGGKLAVDADVVIAEALFRAARIPELKAHLESVGEFKNDRRWLLMSARAERAAKGDFAQCERWLLTILNQNIPDHVERMASFELIAIYEKSKRHDESWMIATRAHSRTQQRFDLDGFVNALAATAKAAESGRLARARKASRPANRTAFIFGMPRSGTTLIEQMLDCHPLVRGIGELSVHSLFENAIGFEGAPLSSGRPSMWPEAMFHVSANTLDRCQLEYRQMTRDKLKLSPNIWTLDKTVFPALKPMVFGPVFPGCRVISVKRDARDNAVSLYLNNLNPDVDGAWSWTTSLDTIRSVILAQRKYTPTILKGLDIPMFETSMEKIVEDTEVQAKGMVSLLGLEWNPACLHPEKNQRIVHTLSHEQVRRPINRDGMGRWKNHASRFDSGWDELE